MSKHRKLRAYYLVAGTRRVLEGEQIAMRDAAEEGRKAVASAQTDVQRLASRCSALEADVSRSRAAYANLASDAASTKEALADANAMLESEGKW